MKISKQIIPRSKYQRPGTYIKPRKIVWHSTANTATAQNERDNLARKSNKRYASFHYVIDDKQIIQCIPDYEIAYHAGSCNRHSIGVEMCEGGNRSKVVDGSIKFAAYLLKKHKLSIHDLIRHFDCTGKNCPRILNNDGKWSDWIVFKTNVAMELKGGSNSMNRKDVENIVLDIINPSRNGGSPDAHWAYKHYVNINSRFPNIMEERRFDDVLTRGEMAKIIDVITK